jgi:NhaA family Na+:H+ antiporter
MVTTSSLPRPLHRLPRPLREFLQLEVSGGILLLGATVVALIWANAPFGESYERWWNNDLTIGFGDAAITESLRHWVNDALMAIFFFVAGLEIKRELSKGELRDPKTAALPVIAALGGMVVPALLYVALNAGSDDIRGWGIPMATDIAFALGLLSLFGSRVSQSLKIFLLSLAIVDDIGAILVIALFYTESLALGWLVVAVLLLCLTWVLRARRVVATPLYLILGVLVWFFTFESGVHATIAGVALGLVTPARPFDPRARATPAEDDDVETSVADRLLHQVHPYSSYAVVPLFALANAGIPLGASGLRDAVASSVAWGVFVGLVVGKLVGITAFSWLATRIRLATLPADATWRQIVGVAALGGVGFTVSLFIAGLAFNDARAEVARVAILAASAAAALIGSVVLAGSRPAPETSEPT